MSETEVVPNARLELLRSLAWYRDWHEAEVKAGRWEADFCRLAPLEESRDDYGNAWDDILLAARECAALGEIELERPSADPLRRHFCAITDVGYARIRTHDAIGEVQQESPFPRVRRDER